MTSPIYLHNWAADGFFAVVRDFEDIYISREEFDNPNDRTRTRCDEMQRALAKPDYQEAHILLASYSTENYAGDAFVLFEQGGKLFEVNGSHCSCYGLEGQWRPEEVDYLSLWHRITKGTLGADDWTGNIFRDELIEVLRQWALDHPGECSIPQ
jgi:hypothetical protein